MTRKTSIETFHQIEAEGLLSAKRFEVYRCIFKDGPLSSSELILKLDPKRSLVHTSTYQVRLGELRDLGVLEEAGTEKCRITGRQVILWDVTGRVPINKKNTDEIRRRELVRKLASHKRSVMNLEKAIERIDVRLASKKQFPLFDSVKG